MSSWRNRLENSITECENKDDRENLIAQLSRDIREQFRKVQPGESDSNRGIWLTNIKQAREGITRELTQDINRFLVTLLHPSQPDFSVANTRAWLEALSTEFNQSYRNIEDRVNSNSKIHSLEEVERKWQDTAQTIEDIESKGGLLPFNKKKKNSQVREEAKRIVGEVNKLIKHNFDFVLTRETLEIIKSLQHYVNDLNTKASNFYNLLNSIQLAYEKTEIELKQLNVDEMSGEAIFADADTDDCYQSLLPARDRAIQLALVTTKITEKIGLGESLATCLDAGLIDETQLIEEINLIVDGLFGSRSLDRVQSAIKRFLENYSLSDRATRLEQILREAEPLLPLNTSDPYFYNDSGKSADIIGFKDTDNREVTQFKQILFNDLGVPDSQLKPIQAEDEIIFVNEYGAFPLRLIQGLSKMREHYQRHQTYDSFLHNDYQTEFTDIIPPDGWEIKRLQDIFYPALAFELLPYNKQTKKYEFEYHVDDYRNRFETIYLSYVWDKALEQLASRQDMANALDEKLKIAIADLTNDPSKWNSYYLPKLNQFEAKVKNLPKEDPNYLYVKTVVGVEATADNPRQDGIINRFWKKMQDVVREEIAKQQQPQQQAKFSANSTGDRILLEENTSQPNLQDNVVSDNFIADSSVIEAEVEESNSVDPMAELKELIQMKKEGFLSAAQFEAAKQKILGI